MDVSEPGIFYTVATFLVLLSVLVFIHEWGHYIVARIFKTKVDVFSIGFGKEIFGRTDKSGTRWKLSMLPLGGYVKFYGDANAISNPEKTLASMSPEDREGCFHFKPLWQRMLIVAAGPVINIIFAIFIFIGFAFFLGDIVRDPVVGAVSEGMPAAEAGLQVGDRVLEVDGSAVDSFNDMATYIYPRAEVPIEFLVDRNGQVLSLTLTPVKGELTNSFDDTISVGKIGIASHPDFTTRYDYTFGQAIISGVKFTFSALGMMFDFLGRIVTGNFSKEEVGGPVKIAEITGKAASQGIGTFMYLMGLISINLGFVNLLPIPLLDGGHLLFYSIEAIKGKPISVRAQELASMLGLAFVLGLLFVLTWNDLKLPGLS